MKRIFIVGCPRSGTTLLQSLIACSPEIMTFQETFLFSRTFSSKIPFNLPIRSPYKEAKRVLNDGGFADKLSPSSSHWLGWPISQSISRYLLKTLDNIAIAHDKDGWLEKTPRHLYSIDVINSAANLEPVNFVHILRDGVQVAASIANASKSWKKTNMASDALTRWEKDMAISRRYLNKENHYFIGYESLVADPTSVILELAKTLDLELEKSHLKNRHEVMKKIIHRDEKWKADTAGEEIRPLNRTSDHLSEEEINELNSQINRIDYNYLKTFCIGNSAS